MAKSRVSRLPRMLVRLLLAAFLFGFMPYLVFQAACGKQKETTLDQAFGKSKGPQFGGDSAATAKSKGAEPPPTPSPTQGKQVPNTPKK